MNGANIQKRSEKQIMVGTFGVGGGTDTGGYFGWRDQVSCFVNFLK